MKTIKNASTVLLIHCLSRQHEHDKGVRHSRDQASSSAFSFYCRTLKRLSSIPQKWKYLNQLDNLQKVCYRFIKPAGLCWSSALVEGFSMLSMANVDALLEMMAFSMLDSYEAWYWSHPTESGFTINSPDKGFLDPVKYQNHCYHLATFI